MTGLYILLIIGAIICLIGIYHAVDVEIKVQRKGEQEPLKIGVELDKIGSVRLRNDATGQYLDTSCLMQDGFRIGTTCEDDDRPYNGCPYVQVRFLLNSIDGVQRKGVGPSTEIPREFLLRKLQEAGDD